ncbi:MAG: hypothetical protein HYZ24_04270 [Chloroflexi bacterium]|nr:hypothetical protein [Chloroflexota bacterium]
MDTNLIIAIVGALIPIIGVLVAYFQWRKDVQLKLAFLQDQVTAELVRQRMQPYAKLMEQLEALSRQHLIEMVANPKKKRNTFLILQTALYGSVGLLASHDTREILVYAREGCRMFDEKKMEEEELGKRIWALHLGLRSDLGIFQPEWPSEIERLRKKISSERKLQVPREDVYKEVVRKYR